MLTFFDKEEREDKMKVCWRGRGAKRRLSDLRLEIKQCPSEKLLGSLLATKKQNTIYT